MDWVREVHRHTSITKAGRSRVMFRSSNNDKVMISMIMMIMMVMIMMTMMMMMTRWRLERS